MAPRSSRRSEPGRSVAVTRAGDDRDRSGKNLFDGAAARMQRATLIPLFLLVPLIFLPLRTPTEALAQRCANVAIHLGVSLLAFALVRRLGARALVAPATALLFAVHPVHVEAIATTAGRADLLGAGFALAALLSFTHAGPWRVHGAIVAPGAGRHAAAWLTGGCLLLALTVSVVGLAVPALLLGLEWLFRPRQDPTGRSRWRTRGVAFAPAAVALLAFIGLRARGLTWNPSVTPPADGGDLPNALALLARQVGSLFYPIDLSAQAAWTLQPPQTDLARPLPLLGLAVLAGLVWVSARTFVGKRRTGFGSRASFASLLFLIPYVAVAVAVALGRLEFAERSLYFPSVGFCFLLALAIGAVSTGLLPGTAHRRPGPNSDGQVRLAAATLAALILGFSILTWARCLAWRDERPAQVTASRVNRVGEKGSSSSDGFPSTIQRVR